jgi:hypothetical protein
MSYELAQKFEDFKIPEAFLQARKLGMGMGSLDFTKMMLFANEVQLNNDNIDYFMSLPPRRQVDETKEQL